TARPGGLRSGRQLQARMIQILRTSLLGLGSFTACVNWESAKPLTAMSIRTGTLAGRSFGWYSQPLNVLTLLTGVKPAGSAWPADTGDEMSMSRWSKVTFP